MMKKDYFVCKKLFTLYLIILSLFFVTSCGEQVEGYSYRDKAYRNDNPSAYVVILGAHANAMAIPQDAYNVMENLFSDAVYGGYVCAIVADATPTKIEIMDDKDFFIEDAKNTTVLKRRIEERSSKLIEQLIIKELVADTPEVDLLAAIREAKNALSSSQLDAITNKQIIIVDTGISTAGELNFVDFDFLYKTQEISDIVEQLRGYESVGVLPDLSGITVTFIGTNEGLAEVAGPQKASITDKKYIKNLWTEVINACGAENILFESIAGWNTPNIYTEDDESKFPYVSVITFFHDKVISLPDLAMYESNDPDSIPDLPEPPTFEVKLASETVGFQPNSSNYLNEENAKTVLHPFADDLKEFFEYYPDEKIWIVGTTATTKKGGDGSVELSLERAEMVKKTLVSEFEVPEEKILTIGVGARFPWAVDACVSGSFDTNVAQSNRAVWLLTGDSDKFRSIRSAYDNNELLPETMLRLESFD